MTTVRHLIRCALLFAIGGACVAGTLACGSSKEEIKQQRFQKGKEYAARNQWAEAIVEFSAAIQQDAKFGEGQYALAQAYDQSKQPVKAFGAYVRAADALPDNIDAQIKAATFLLVAKRYTDAQERARKALDKDPKNVPARIILGNALAGLKQFDEAVTELRDAIEMEPGRSELYTNLGVMQLTNAHGDEAEATFKKAIEVDPAAADAHLALANYYWSTGRMKEAEFEIKQTLALQPRHIIANRALVEIYLVSRRAREAEGPMKALADFSNDPIDRIALAALYIDMGRVKEARTILEPLATIPNAAARLASLEYSQGNGARAHKVLDDVLAKDPKNPSVLVMKGRLLYLDKKYDDAFKVVSTAVAANPDIAQAHYALGMLQQDKNDLDGAYKSFAETVRLNPRAAAAQMRLAQLTLGRGSASTALTFAEAAAKGQRGSLDARLAVARSMISAGRTADAEKQVQSLMRDSPKVATVQTLAGSLQVLKGDRKSARLAYERALELQPGSAEAIAGLVNVDMLEKNLPAARARIEAAAAKWPKSIPILLMAGVVYKASGDAAASERMFKKAIELDPSNPQGYAALGQLYVSQKRLDDARREFEGIGQRDPKSVMSATMTGVILQMQGKSAEAKKRYEAALQLDPHATVAANNLAWLYAQDGEKLDTALQLAQAAMQRNPDDLQVNDTLGWIYVKKDLAATAVPLLKQVVARSPKDASFRYHLGMAYLNTGDHAQAKESLEAALRLQADFAGAEQARKALALMK